MLDENPNDVENVPQSPLFANENTPLLILLLTVRTFNPTFANTKTDLTRIS